MTKSSRHPTVLVVAPLTAFALFWILVRPGTFKDGLVKNYAVDVLKGAVPDTFPVPSDTITKYGPHPFVRYTHILTSALWSALALAQVSITPFTSSKTKWQRSFHRWSGRCMLLSSLVITVGYVELERRGLSFAHGSTAKSASVWAVALWFVVTAVQAGRYAWQASVVRQALVPGITPHGHAPGSALGALRTLHESWALRHMASGMWVMVQRMMLMGLGAAAGFGVVAFPTEEVKREVFGAVGFLAWLLSCGLCEVSIAMKRSKVKKV